MSQRSIVDKADIAVSQLTTTGGYLTTEQANQFIRKLQDAVALIGSIRVVRMNAPTREINKIGFGDRIMRPAAGSTTPLAAADRSAPTTDKLTLTTSKMMAEVHIPYDVLEDNIERGRIEDTMMDMIIERVAIDQEELLIQGDTTSSDAYLAQFDGILAKIVTHVVAQGNTIDRAMFKNGMLQMPDKYLRNYPQMRHYLSPSQHIAYIDTLAGRATNVGDSAAESAFRSSPFGIPIENVALMPVASGFFTYPQNLIYGIQRDVMIETDKDIRSQELIVVVSMRVAFEIEEEDACVKYTGITAP
jgi:hypothetical protein